MDRMIYVAMSGAKQALNQQATVSHNLANLTTNGFRAETSVFRAVPVVGEGAATRSFVVDSTPGADFTPGVLQRTGRDLDVAIEGKGWIAVQAADGSEAYTRNGSLQINANGVLQTRNGNSVMGDGGIISIPSDTLVTIASDGTLSTVPTNNRPSQNSIVGRIKLVNPPEGQLVRGNDGLFRARSNVPAPADANVRIAAGSLESSNVNAVDAMVNMIALARGFEMHMKLLQNAEASDRQAAQLLTMQG